VTLPNLPLNPFPTHGFYIEKARRVKWEI
jgi:hypothetical protein